MIKEKRNDIQFLRAIAIIAVICIHTCPIGVAQVYIRPFINYAVALFVFLSGYLTKIENDNWLSFFRKRISRVLIPYCIWTVFYVITQSGTSIQSILTTPKHLLLADAIVPLYYIPVYIGLVLITPLLSLLIKTKYRNAVWMISPFYKIIIFYLPLVFSFQYSSVITKLPALWFMDWLIYYFLGIILGNHLCSSKFNIKLMISLFVFSLILQSIEGHILYTKFNYMNCGTQSKLTCLASNIFFLLIIHTLLQAKRLNINSTLTEKIGDYSFGIYLCHVSFINHFPYLSYFPFPINSLLVLLMSLAFCWICDHALNRRVCKWLGII